MHALSNVRSTSAKRLIAAAFAGGLVLAPALTQAQDASHEPLSGLQELKVVFDLKQGDPNALLSSLNAIDDVRQSLIEEEVTPRIVLTFRGPATRLAQTDQSAIADELHEGAAEVAAKISELRSAEGISGVEQCGLTVAALGMEPEDTIEGLTVVDNSWTTIAAYQAQGYSYIVP